VSASLEKPLNARAKAALLAEALFEGLGPRDLEWLAEMAEVREYAKGQTVFDQGDAAKHLFVVESGRLKIFTTSVNGQENVLGMFGSGTHVAIVALFGFDAYPAGCQALEPSRVLALPARRVAERLSSEPATAMALLKQAGKRLDLLVSNYLDLKGLTPIQRLARHLLDLAGTDGANARIVLPYSRAVLAAAIGIAPENLSRAFARLAQIGVTGDGAAIEIASLEKLKDVARGKL
jgi:CRP-like cAMP-binding protein